MTPMEFHNMVWKHFNTYDDLSSTEAQANSITKQVGGLTLTVSWNYDTDIFSSEVDFGLTKTSVRLSGGIPFKNGQHVYVPDDWEWTCPPVVHLAEKMRLLLPSRD